MTTQIARWGNSLAVRLPKAIAAEAQVTEGDTIAIFVKDGAIVLEHARPRFVLEDLVSRISAKNRHRETEWGGPVGGESW